jgi:hypothetical protein
VPAVFGDLKKSVCSAVDTNHLAFNDYKGEACDALSIVFQFDAVPASISGTHENSSPDASVCGAGFPQPCEL